MSEPVEPTAEGAARLANRMLEVIERQIVPKTRAGVERGNKIFGAAILLRSDLSVVVAETNNETENPLWHGEIHAIKRFYELPSARRPDPKDCHFLATHEPCSLCLSGIAWGGFDNFTYLFSHRDSQDSFAIPYDIQILKAVYAVPEPGAEEPSPARDLYNRSNSFFTSRSLAELIVGLPEASREPLAARIEAVSAECAGLSRTYQKDKGGQGIPLA